MVCLTGDPLAALLGTDRAARDPVRRRRPSAGGTIDVDASPEAIQQDIQPGLVWETG